MGKYVWPWTGPHELTNCLKGVAALDGCLSEYCIVQEWVDYDFELRMFFFPPRTWNHSTVVRPAHYAYTGWGDDAATFGQRTFKILSKHCVMQVWQHDGVALAQAHDQAEETAQYLIAKMVSVHSEPPPFIRLDFMMKRVGPGAAQVVFGEYCETGACCIDEEWRTQGPPRVWSAVPD